MAKETLHNMIKFSEFDHLQPVQKPTKKTEIGGFAVLEKMSIKDLLKIAKNKTGQSKKELKKLSPKKLKKLVLKDMPKKGEEKEPEEKETSEGLLYEKKKASAKQKAARANFMAMIGKKKKCKPCDDEE
jgi:hypothetical protein